MGDASKGHRAQYLAPNFDDRMTPRPVRHEDHPSNTPVIGYGPVVGYPTVNGYYGPAVGYGPNNVYWNSRADPNLTHLSYGYGVPTVNSMPSASVPEAPSQPCGVCGQCFVEPYERIQHVTYVHPQFPDLPKPVPRQEQRDVDSSHAVGRMPPFVDLTTAPNPSDAVTNVGSESATQSPPAATPSTAAAPPSTAESSSQSPIDQRPKTPQLIVCPGHSPQSNRDKRLGRRILPDVVFHPEIEINENGFTAAQEFDSVIADIEDELGLSDEDPDVEIDEAYIIRSAYPKVKVPYSVHARPRTTDPPPVPERQYQPSRLRRVTPAKRKPDEAPPVASSSTALTPCSRPQMVAGPSRVREYLRRRSTPYPTHPGT